MLALELEAAGYGLSARSADLVIADLDSGVTGDITFSRGEGADLRRPFGIDELFALVEEKLGGKGEAQYETLQLSDTSASALYRGCRVELSDLEYKLLCYLYRNRDRYVSVSELSEKIFGNGGAQNPVRVYISYLRDKLDEAFKVKFIFTSRGKGYILKIK